MSDIAIRVENLSKQYHIGQTQQRHDTLRDALAAGLGRLRRNRKSEERRPRDDTFWALKDVSFRGEARRSGGHYRPQRRRQEHTAEDPVADHRADERAGPRSTAAWAALLEVGTGFHPELTGRENIYLNGAILGMHRTEIERQFDEIVAFAEIEKFLDTPVKRYTSGMYVRLAFAVAAHLEPEILLVDEVLAVGDAAFQKKCLGKMGDVAQDGRTVLFVSHNMGAISALCTRTIHLSSGHVHRVGNTKEIVDGYLTQLFHHSFEDLDDLRSPKFGNTVRFTEIQLKSGTDSKLLFGEPLEYQFTILSKTDLEGLSLGSSFFDPTGSCIGGLVTKETFSVEANRPRSLRLSIPGMNLAPGNYYAGFSIGEGGTTGPRYDHDIVAGPSLFFQILPVAQSDGAPINWSPGWGDVIFRETSLSVEEDVRDFAIRMK